MLTIKNFSAKNYLKDKEEKQHKASSASQQSLANSLVAQNLAGMNGNVQPIQQPAVKQD